jgi:hypothetical protein
MKGNLLPPNPPKTTLPADDHRRQMLWQVWVPILASVLCVLSVALLVIAGAAAGSSQIERLANISAVIVIIPQLIIGVLIFAIVGGSAYGMFMLLKRMPLWMLQTQLFVLQLALIIRKIADALVKPIISVHTFSARVSALWRKFV